MKKRHTFTGILFALSLAASVLSGCGKDSTGVTTAETSAAEQASSQGSAAAGETSDEPITIKAVFTTGMTGAINRFAIEKGLYEAEGIKFDLTEVKDNAERMAAITRGDGGMWQTEIPVPMYRGSTMAFRQSSSEICGGIQAAIG